MKIRQSVTLSSDSCYVGYNGNEITFTTEHGDTVTVKLSRDRLEGLQKSIKDRLKSLDAEAARKAREKDGDSDD